MKLSMPTTVTSTPLISPTKAPRQRTRTTTSGQGIPIPCKPMASTWVMPRMKATDRSNRLAAIGIIAASATIA